MNSLSCTAGKNATRCGTYSFGRNGEYGITVANTLEDRKRAWRMVYASYLEKGYAEASPEQLWCGLYDALPQTTTFVVTRNDVDVATLTIVFDSDFGLPADQIYRDELDRLRRKGRRLCEVVSLASNENDRRQGIEVLKHLFKLSLHMASKVVDATDFIITVNPHHAAYYERKLLFNRVGDVRSYAKVGGAPAVLLSLDLVTLSDKYMEAYGRQEGSIWHHFFDDRTQDEVVFFLAGSVQSQGRKDLMAWFAENRPAVIERISRYISPFDVNREVHARHAMTAGMKDIVDPAIGVSPDQMRGSVMA